ncbi:alanine transaminase [Puccinia graminis f. sp. tritici CRL 75-36-700-3]|uniref:Glutamate pyruvate transaminase n=1 Tax=Puccinia graminis f. sp. tritici (strain CRL 75-36-700-3 / race SCCL) TaxID=418459 RepID=E3KD89_PUCGT|nr:alanine transaminase [Puccinia graminis f. sp. tritici CRL 75-36-700-3]EFP82113.2 alanine transaminase [Puccinia graminis f. sp. tritici CRL 75-36-700-3]
MSMIVNWSKQLISSTATATATATTISRRTTAIRTTNSRYSTTTTTTRRSSKNQTMISVSDLNPAIIQAQYAVRGRIALRAEQLRATLQADPDAKNQLGFDSIINCNIGNPQQLGQKPITFYRQVACLTEYPELMDAPEASKLFPKDVVDRARSLLDSIGSVGAYSHSMGVPIIRQHIAQFIQKRDGFPADPETIYLTAGASAGVSNIMQLLLSKETDGVMIPIPQYPLYTAALALNSARAVEYYLSEADDWAPNLAGLEEVIRKAQEEDQTKVRAMVVISPGNPVGNCLSQESMEAIVRFCFKHKILLLADEVYQTNIFEPEQRPFVSFKKVVRGMEESIASGQGLISFHSISKGQTGECGRRGGYFELVNIPKEVQEQVYKMASIQLCPPLAGQIGVDLQVKPPLPGDESYPLFKSEVDSIAQALADRSKTLADSFNRLDGLSCRKAQGAMYLFPKLELPTKAHQAAEQAGLPVDEFYCMELLNQTGICIIPGSGFGQEPGTFHFRTTFLAPQVEDYVARFKQFHSAFLNTYS